VLYKRQSITSRSLVGGTAFNDYDYHCQRSNLSSAFQKQG